MRCILIDPYRQTVRALDNAGELKDIREALALGENQDLGHCGLGSGVIMYIDDEGLFRSSQRYFFLPSYHHEPIPGRGLIYGLVGPEHVSCPLTVERVLADIEWPDIEYVDMTTTTEKRIHPLLGEVTHINSRANFRLRTVDAKPRDA